MEHKNAMLVMGDCRNHIAAYNVGGGRKKKHRKDSFLMSVLLLQASLLHFVKKFQLPLTSLSYSLLCMFFHFH